MPARDLVIGDLIHIKAGDVVPADCVLLPNCHPIQVDQSAITGEHLPVTIYPQNKARMSSVIKFGEAKAVVCETGA